jgi:hypothetical protein
VEIERKIEALQRIDPEGTRDWMPMSWQCADSCGVLNGYQVRTRADAQRRSAMRSSMETGASITAPLSMRDCAALT